MFNLNNYIEIENHLKSISRIYKQTNNNWIQIFCPFCGDATRKANPTHGHLYLSKSFPYFLCFRCNSSGNLIKLLLHTEFNNHEIINTLQKISKNNIDYLYYKHIENKNINKVELYEIINKQHDNFIQNYGFDDYNQFRNYLDKRSIDIYPTNYLISPVKYDNNLFCQIYNFNNQIVSHRSINNSTYRHSHNEINLYYFQDNINNLLNIKILLYVKECLI